MFRALFKRTSNETGRIPASVPARTIEFHAVDTVQNNRTSGDPVRVGFAPPEGLPLTLSSSQLRWCSKTEADHITAAIYAPPTWNGDKLLTLIDRTQDRLAAMRIAEALDRNILSYNQYVSEIRAWGPVNLRPPDGLPRNLSNAEIFWCGPPTDDHVTSVLYAPNPCHYDRLSQLANHLSGVLGEWRCAPTRGPKTLVIAEPLKTFVP